MKEAWLLRELAKLGVSPEDAVAQGYQITTRLHQDCMGAGVRIVLETKPMAAGEDKLMSAQLTLCECLHLEKRQ